MKIFIVEDDINVIKILKMIIEDHNIGEVVGHSLNGNDGFREISILKPDIVLVDLLMPEKDGISLVLEIKKTLPSIHFIMLSQVADKDMIAKAYESGVEFYINKPVNAIEVERVLNKSIESITMNRTLNKIQNIFEKSQDNIQVKEITNTKEHIKKLKFLMQRIGIMGEIGSEDIINIIDFLIVNKKSMSDYTMKELCAIFSENPKSMEQRIRRTANVGMINLANLGIEDYMNEIFIEYSNGLYNFQQVKKEMDYIRGKSKIRGKISIKKFMNGLVFYCEK
ncbi:response regulator [Hathewaya histolytica]|uniref:Stage 0 sporulation protein A homolog n=2 Tax=Hathewaya histolytica TaxID=1498 RepID=A0A4U9RU09_HATHI|nr:response regulator [Hathewaya histolytica]VTQ95649.1 signal transduction response regulator [Hathewaya histolytica]